MLPILDASSALVLGEEMVVRAKEEALTNREAAALRRMKQMLAVLGEAARARLAGPTFGEEDRRAAHFAEGTAWKGLHDLVSAWSRLSVKSGGENVEHAKRIEASVFGDGLKFLRLAYKESWMEAEQRLKWIAEEELDETFREIGGLVFLEELRAMHKKSGEILGITKVLAAAEPPVIREPLDAFCARLRAYVVQVVAEADAGDEQAKARAARLLAPLTGWQSARGKNARAPEVAPQPPAVPPPATPSMTPPMIAPATPDPTTTPAPPNG